MNVGGGAKKAGIFAVSVKWKQEVVRSPPPPFASDQIERERGDLQWGGGVSQVLV